MVKSNAASGGPWKQGKLDVAAKKFEEAVAIDPDAADAWNGLGWTRFNGGEADEAITAFEKCVALEPEHPARSTGSAKCI